MNLYAYTKQEFIDLAVNYGGLFVKVGCSKRDPMIRINEQQSTSDATAPIVVGTWMNTEFDSDKEIHDKLESLGCRSNKLIGAGTEWFFIKNAFCIEIARVYLDKVIGQTATKQSTTQKGMKFFSGEGRGLFKLIIKLVEMFAVLIVGGKVGRGDSGSWNYVKHTRGIKIRRD